MQIQKIPNVLVIGPQSIKPTEDLVEKLEQVIDRELNNPLAVNLYCGDGLGFDSVAQAYGKLLNIRNAGKTFAYNNKLHDKNFKVVTERQLFNRYKRLIEKKDGKFFDLVIVGKVTYGFFDGMDLEEDSYVDKLVDCCIDLDVPVSSVWIQSEEINVEFMNIEDAECDYVPLEYDHNGESIGAVCDPIMLEILEDYPDLSDLILDATANGIKPAIIHPKSASTGDRMSFLTIPTAINHKFISPEQYINNIYEIRKIMDNTGIDNLVIPRLGAELLNGEWDRRGGNLCELLFDSRLTVVYPDLVATDEYQEYHDRVLEIQENDELYDAFQQAMEIDCTQGFDHILDELEEVRDSLFDYYKSDKGVKDSEVLDKTNTDMQRLIEFLFSKQNARRYFLNDIEEIDDVENKLLFTEHLIRNWAEDQKEKDHLRLLDKSRLYLGNFNIRNMLIEILIRVQAMKVKSRAPELTAIAGSVLSMTPFGHRLENAKGDSNFKCKKRGMELAACVLALMERGELLRFEKSPRRKTRPDGSSFYTGIWSVDIPEFASETTKLLIDLSMTLPPMISKPKLLEKNSDVAYQTTKGHVISNPYHRHDDELCLDILNKYNQTAYSLDMDAVLGGEQKFKKPKNWSALNDDAQKVVKDTWKKQMEISEFVHELMYRMGNRFHFAWFYDYRGRIYSPGYHITVQGADYKKSVIMFANKEEIFEEDTKAQEFKDFLSNLQGIELPFSE